MQSGYDAESALGYVQLTSLGAATSLTVPAGTALVLIQPEGQAVRWRDDGVNPTAGVGYPLAVGIELAYTGRAFSGLRFIEQIAGAKLNILFYGV